MQSFSRRDFISSGVAFSLLSAPALAGERRLPRVIRPTGNMEHVRKVPLSFTGYMGPMSRIRSARRYPPAASAC